jgi:Beta-propeller repeat
VRAVILCFIAALLQAQPVNPVFATYFGGGGYEIPGSVTTDHDGNIYIAGRTDSPDFPVKNALQPESRAFSQLFIAKFSPAGELIYSTYFGGSDNDAATSIAADRAGNVYLTGSLHSKDFPTTDAIQAQPGGGVDAFVLKLDPAGKVVYSTYLGGRFNDIGTSITVDASGSAYLAGWTESPDFPTSAGRSKPSPQAIPPDTPSATRSSPSSIQWERSRIPPFLAALRARWRGVSRWMPTGRRMLEERRVPSIFRSAATRCNGRAGGQASTGKVRTTGFLPS